MKTYPSDLTESQWQVIENLIDPNQRKRKYCLRDIMNALLYITKSGIQWRMLPKDYAPWESVYYYFRKWKRDGLIEETHDFLVEKVRIGIGKKPTPSVGIIDSQSVKACNLCEGDVGYDGGKKTKGRKRHIVVDTLGLVMIIVIHAANIHDSVGAREVMKSLKDKYLTGIRKIFADGGYMGELIEWVWLQFGWTLEIVKRNETGTFKVLPKRWIVERTFAWLSFHRRMSKDYERLPESGIAFIQLSMIRLMVNRISI
ncbi:MAG: IS5 family transposase [Bacteroidales bacterium]|nr:IS5 family transposase [Bacteroidales bacterium]